ncbi:molecular chaperone GrpE [Tamaricihabitans halophyticus]|uniref:Protein GrpE n=1 Tax=Tamaricihabitans halophyticus TaxID=1262583 RepID=A0A4R2R3U6_9PSEU|nr:nucleotide exchange factor GrpE [Tamaricihabitans halophyticus]TCP57243.1 molecular chaperone GrpE [Tamaricihabitans halophyticus]
MTPQPPQPKDETQPEEPIVVKDRRRIDPESGQVREEVKEETVEPPAAAPGEPGAPAADESASPAGSAGSVDEAADTAGSPDTELTALKQELAERTADVKRVQAEFANYRKRVDRDRDSVIEGAKASLAGELLPLLDDLERAEAHGDLTGPFKAIADKLVAALEKEGLASYGAEGDEFDPAVHEAVQHATSSEVDGPTVTTVLRKGYRIGDKVLRNAMVAVTDHEPAAEPEPVPEAVEVLADDTTGPIPTPGMESNQ